MVTKVAYLFPGQGSQVIGMGKMAFDKSEKVKSLFSIADNYLGFSLSTIMFEGPEEKLRDTSITQPALFLASAAALELLKEKSINAIFSAGHSLGEYSALYSAGVISFQDTLHLVRQRGLLMNQASAGAMAAIIGLETLKVAQICQEASVDGKICAPANFNSETQIVISGDTVAVQKAMELSKAVGALKVISLNVSGAFHSPLMAEAANKMKEVLSSISFSNAKFPVITNVDAIPTTSADEFKRKLIQQIDHPVKWHESMKKLLELGVESFIEVGSGRVLSTMAKKLDRKKSVFCTDEFENIESLVAGGTPSN